MQKNNTLSQTKRQIIEVSERLFTQGNFSSVSMSEIAKKLNLSKPAIYHHFKNKEDLYLTILKRSHEQYINGLKKIITDSKLSPREKFEKIVIDFLEQHNKNCKSKNNCPSTILMHKQIRKHKKIAEFMNEARTEAKKAVLPFIKDIIKKNNMPAGTNPEILFQLVFGAMSGFLFEKLINNKINWKAKEVAAHLSLLVFQEK